MKPYPKYKDSSIEWIGKIPEHWDVEQLKWNTTFEYGVSLSSEARKDGDIPVFGSNGITGFHDAAITKSPCLIIGRKGSFGKVNWSDKECFPIDTTYYVDQTKTINNLRWLYYILLNLRLDQFSRDTGVPGLNREDAYQNFLPLPPISEQTAIAAFLDRKTAEIDKLIANKQKLIGLYEEKKQAIIKQSVTKGLDPDASMKDSGIEWLGEIPEHWEVKKLKWVTKNILTGKTPSSTNPSYYNGNINWFSPGDFNDEIVLSNSTRKITSLAISEAGISMYPANSILLIGIGATLGKVGLIKDSGTSNQQINAIICDSDFILPYYGLYFLYVHKQVIISHSNSATLAILNQSHTKELIVTVPPINEQNAIVKHIEITYGKIDQIIEKLEKQVVLYQEYRTALISEVVTGKVKVAEENQCQ